MCQTDTSNISKCFWQCSVSQCQRLNTVIHLLYTFLAKINLNLSPASPNLTELGKNIYIQPDVTEWKLAVTLIETNHAQNEYTGTSMHSSIKFSKTPGEERSLKTERISKGLA